MKSLFTQNLVNHFENSRYFFLVITDIRGRLIYTNSLFEEKSGYTPQQQSSFFIADIIADNTAKKCNEIIRECLRHPDKVSGASLGCYSQGGFSFRIYWELSVLLNKNNHPEGIQWIGVEECSNDIQKNKTGI